MTGRWTERLVFAVMSVALAGVAALALYFAAWCCEFVGVPPASGSATVLAREYHPATMFSTVTMVGNSAVPQFHHIPESWSVALAMEGEGLSGPVSREVYEVVRPGDVVPIIFRRGRFTQSTTLDAVGFPASEAAW